MTAVFAAASALAGWGIFLLLCRICGLPSRRASRCMLSAAKKMRTSSVSKAELALAGLSRYISQKIRLGEAKKESVTRSLRSAGTGMMAEAHVADCIVRAGIIAAFALPAALIFPVSSPVILVAAVCVYADARAKPGRIAARKREAIELELPMFVSRIDSMIRNNRDVVSILDSCRKSAGPELSEELAVTVADMQSGSLHAALTRLESRVGSAPLSDVVRGLSAVADGNDPVGYWAALFTRLTDNRRQMLIRQAKKIPAKISVLSFCLLASIFLLYVVVIGGEVVRSLGIMFG